jgi:ABC-type phosphate/phosphonate transport system substrate-binding protein
MAIAALIALLVAGCGSSSSSSSGSSGASSSASSSTAASSSTESSEGESNLAGEFIKPGKKNKEINLIIKAGTEAEAAEREAASKALEENLEARAGKDWEVQCETLAAELVKAVEQGAPPTLAKAGCAKLLAELAKQASPQVLENTMEGPIDALRVKGNQGFALYHGKGGKDYIVPLTKEGGEWKVASLTTEEIP